MRIVSLYKIPKPTGRIKAEFCIDFGIILIRGCKLIEGDRGQLWAAMPSKEYTDKQGKRKFAGVVEITDTKIMDVITNAAREVFYNNKKDSDNYELSS